MAGGALPQAQRTLPDYRARNLVGAKRQAELPELEPEAFQVDHQVTATARLATCREKHERVQPLRLTRAHDMQYTTTVASADRGAKDAGGWTATVMPNGVAAMLPFIAATGLDHADTRIGE